jgi:hypothetical protein
MHDVYNHFLPQNCTSYNLQDIAMTLLLFPFRFFPSRTGIFHLLFSTLPKQKEQQQLYLHHGDGDDIDGPSLS